CGLMRITGNRPFCGCGSTLRSTRPRDIARPANRRRRAWQQLSNATDRMLGDALKYRAEALYGVRAMALPGPRCDGTSDGRVDRTPETLSSPRHVRIQSCRRGAPSA